MRPIVTAGVGLAVITGLWMFVDGATGLYLSPGLGWLSPALAVVIQLGALIWGLQRTAEQGGRFGRQVLAGLLISVIGGLLIGPLYLMWAAAYPDALEILEGLQADRFADQGMTTEEIARALDQTAFSRTPGFQAIFRVVATLGVGGLLSLLVAAFVREKD